MYTHGTTSLVHMLLPRIFLFKKGFGLIFEGGLISVHSWRYMNQLSFLLFLTFCSLSENKITGEGACEFAGALQVNQSLQQLE